jgi:hypothetical protein
MKLITFSVLHISWWHDVIWLFSSFRLLRTCPTCSRLLLPQALINRRFFWTHCYSADLISTVKCFYCISNTCRYGYSGSRIRQSKIPIPLTSILAVWIVWMEAGNPQMQMWWRTFTSLFLSADRLFILVVSQLSVILLWEPRTPIVCKGKHWWWWWWWWWCGGGGGPWWWWWLSSVQ